VSIRIAAAEVSSYEEACAQHRWEVPDRYNIAADVCDRWPAEKPAMVFEDFRGNERRVSWGEQRGLSNKAANLLARRGVERGDRVAICAPASPETAPKTLTGKIRRIDLREREAGGER
jgi:acetyl-CoA synthetase